MKKTRQAAGILLRAWLAKHWGRVDEDVAIVMKDALLNAFAVEPRCVGELRRVQREIFHSASFFKFPDIYVSFDWFDCLFCLICP